MNIEISAGGLLRFILDGKSDMRGPHNLFRLMRTGATLARTGALKVLFETFEIPVMIRVLIGALCWPIFWMGKKGDKTFEPLPRALVALGPFYIKFGQLLSTRPDIAGIKLADELRLLQDRLPPFSMKEAEKTLSSELGKEWQTYFSELSPPIAAASIAQVHKARLKKTRQEVAIKILRPDVEKSFRRNIHAFHFAALIFEFLSAEARRLRFCEVISYFENLVDRELDLRWEAAAASEFASLTKKYENVKIPWVEFGLSTRRMLVLEWVDGISLGNVEEIKAAGHNPKEIGIGVLEMFLNHALRDGYFHADMHQGNLLVTAKGEIAVLDFGIMGRVDDYTRRVYAEILYGFIVRDYYRVAKVHFEAGYVPANQDINAFAQALRAVGEPIFGMDASHISMARVLSHLFEVTERFGMQTRTELLSLQRTMVVVEGVSRSLHSRLNIWKVAHPIVKKYVNESIGMRAMIGDMTTTAKALSRLGPRLPDMIDKWVREQVNPSPSRIEKSAFKLVLWFSGGVILGMTVMALGIIYLL